jgi:coenzyme F420-0:L-glutamate ligase/coenzyme F420-1:gamma-L-glutamate ligase
VSSPLVLAPVPGLPEVRPGDDLVALLAPHVRAALGEGPVVLVLSSKVVSKAQGLTAPAATRDEVVGRETVRVVVERRAGDRVTRVVESAAGPVMAAAGVDASNVGGDDIVLVLPRDADGAAADLRRGLLAAAGAPPDGPLAVVVSDTAGRPWRAGLTDFALGAAGLRTLADHRGQADADGRPLSVSVRCLADEIAAAADLVKGKADGVPAALVTGVPPTWLDAAGPGARALVRTGASDWFARGHVEAVRAALGVAPGSAASAEVGIASLGDESLAERIARAVALAGHGEQPGAVEIGWSVGEDEVEVSIAGDPLAVGRLAARLEVALHAERLVGVDVRVALSPTTS